MPSLVGSEMYISDRPATSAAMPAARAAPAAHPVLPRPSLPAVAAMLPPGTRTRG